mmetsp:Transcript_92023/g.256373  ORF Transcript_92023/g.256373 Transcript_92023/m.256373 type:complete len:225 (+) Transcript_92023:294-968(+)
MSTFRSPISPSKSRICSSVSVMMPLLRSRSALHHWSSCRSIMASSSMVSIIFAISSSTTSKGLPASRSAAALASLGDLPEPAAASSKRRRAASLVGAGSEACGWTSKSWTSARPVEPSLVAATFPKSSKEESRLRIAMASVIAASSLARSIFRSWYSFAFLPHIGRISERKSSRTSFSLIASLNSVFFAASSPSLSPREVCLSSYISDIFVCLSSMEAPKLLYA